MTQKEEIFQDKKKSRITFSGKRGNNLKALLGLLLGLDQFHRASLSSS
jgi:hypothetical protein